MMKRCEDLPPVLDQGSINSATAHAVAVCITAKQQIGVKDDGTPRYQGLVYTYWRCREWKRAEEASR